MKYCNNLSIATLVALPALFIGIVLGGLALWAVCTSHGTIIPILGLISAVLVLISSIALFAKKIWSRILMSFGLHAFIAVFALGCILNHSEGLWDIVTIFAFAVMPIMLLILCVHNQSMISELEKSNS